MNKWRILKNETPKDGQRVICYTIHGTYEVFTWDSKRETWFRGHDTGYYMGYVTHWAECLEPPGVELKELEPWQCCDHCYWRGSTGTCCHARSEHYKEITIGDNACDFWREENDDCRQVCRTCFWWDSLIKVCSYAGRNIPTPGNFNCHCWEGVNK